MRLPKAWISAQKTGSSTANLSRNMGFLSPVFGPKIEGPSSKKEVKTFSVFSTLEDYESGYRPGDFFS